MWAAEAQQQITKSARTGGATFSQAGVGTHTTRASTIKTSGGALKGGVLWKRGCELRELEIVYYVEAPHISERV